MRLKKKPVLLLARSTCVLQTCVRKILEIHHITLKCHRIVLQTSADRHDWTQIHVESSRPAQDCYRTQLLQLSRPPPRCHLLKPVLQI